jgi:dCTP deaminase
MSVQKIWPSQAIRTAVASGIICAERAISIDQIQPASLDLRLGDRAYRVPASFLPGPDKRVCDRLMDLSTHEVDLVRPQVLERNCVYIIPLQESVRLGKTTSARANPKSSSGRLDIFVRVITDGGIAFDEIPEGYQGPLYAEVVPRSFPVIAGMGTCLTQMRLREKMQGMFGEPRLVPVTIDLDPTDKARGIIGYRARRTSGLIDLSRIAAYAISDFWEPVIPRAGGRELVLDPDDFYILASLESIIIGADEAAEMIAYDTSVGEVRVHYAGFLDSGFGLAEAGGEGSRVVLEVRSHDVPYLLVHGQRVATLRYEPMAERPDILYGRSIRSNYQGQGLKLSKHFV